MKRIIEFFKTTDKKKKPLITLGAVFIILFILMSCNIVYFLLNDSYDVVSDPYNTARTNALAKQNTRGTIYARDGEKLAYTTWNNVTQREERIYPYANEFAHVVGYATNGNMGIESYGNMSLSRSRVSLTEKIRLDMEGKKNPGDSIYSTLSVPLQQAAYESMGDYNGAIIVMNPKNGEILAMVSKPDFNPGEIEEIWDETINDEDSSVLLNRATQGVYPPGSIFKIIDTLQYLRENNNQISGFAYDCNGVMSVGDSQIACYHNTKHGSIDYSEAFAKSCNCAFAQIGSEFNRVSFASTLDSLLFHSDMPLQMAYSKSSVALSPESTIDDLLQIAIGQGTMQMTPMHVAMITSAIANHGMLMKPFIIDQVQTADLKTVRDYSEQEYLSLMTEEESLILTDLMEKVVTEGTAEILADDVVQIAGKTGSAEYDIKDKDKSHAWFTGFAPASDPEIVVTVILEEGGFGGKAAANAAKQVFDTYFQ